MSHYILVFDHGTTGIKAVLLDKEGRIKARGYTQFEQIYPQPGWVEHDADTLWNQSIPVAETALKEAQATWQDVKAIGVTNQRETTILWDSTSGEPVHNAIVWQCRRTHELTQRLRSEGKEQWIREKTGLVTDPYFSGSKIQWLLENVPKTQALLQSGHLKFGTVDSWIIWNLSGRKIHITDTSNASRTLLYNIHQHAWDDELLALFNVPKEILPEVKPSNIVYGTTDPALTGGCAIPIAGNIGDQQAALYGQKCWEAGTAKSTYGTGAFIVMNLGQTATTSDKGLLTTIACNAEGEPAYAMEGAIFMAGATLEWLIKSLELVGSPQEANELALSVESTEGVYLVPAFVGLAAPYWNAEARGVISGLTQGSGKAHIARAAFEAMAYQTREVVDIMQRDAGLQLDSIRVDGGVTRSDCLMQCLADQLDIPIIRTQDADITAKGAGYLAGLATGFWHSTEEIQNLPEETESFNPKMPSKTRETLYQGWLNAVRQALPEAK